MFSPLLRFALLSAMLCSASPGAVQVDLKAKQRTESPAQIVARKVTTRLIREAVTIRHAKDNTTALVIIFDHGALPS